MTKTIKDTPSTTSTAWSKRRTTYFSIGRLSPDGYLCGAAVDVQKFGRTMPASATASRPNFL
jgi:hypothetical protein